MQGSSASKKPKSGKSTGHQQKVANDPLLKEVLKHRNKLEGIRDELRTTKLVTLEGSIRITKESVKELMDEIDKIYEFFKSEQKKTDESGFIKDTQGLCNKLDDCMSKFSEALIAWGLSLKSGLSITEDLEAQGLILVHLRMCRTLLEEALGFFLMKQENP